MNKNLAFQELVARNVKAEAARYGLSNEQVQEVLGKSKSAVQARLAGDIEFRLSELDTLARVMEIDVNQFFVVSAGRVVAS